MAYKINIENLKSIRNKKGFTQETLAKKAHISPSVIKFVETGRSETSFENMQSIAKILEVPLETIYKEIKNTKVISIANYKGGVGKTTVTANLGAILADKGYKVLLIDTDPQTNLTQSFGLKTDEKTNIYYAIEHNIPLIQMIEKNIINNMDIIKSDPSMILMEYKLQLMRQRELVMSKLIKPIVNEGIYDFILIDTNPDIDDFNFNILVASDYVVIPVELSMFGVKGIQYFTDFLEEAQEINNNLELLGILLTKVDNRERKVTKQATLVLEKLYKEHLFKTKIHTDATIKQAQFQGLPLMMYANRIQGRANEDFQSLASEVIKSVEKQ